MTLTCENNDKSAYLVVDTNLRGHRIGYGAVALASVGSMLLGMLVLAYIVGHLAIVGCENGSDSPMATSGAISQHCQKPD